MSSVDYHPLDNPEIQQLLSGYLSEYANEFVSNPFAKPSDELVKYNKFLYDALECRDFNVVFYLMSELYPNVDPFVVFDREQCIIQQIFPAARWLMSEYINSMLGLEMLSTAFHSGHYDLFEEFLQIVGSDVWIRLDDCIRIIDRDNITRFMNLLDYGPFFRIGYHGYLNILKYTISANISLDFYDICESAALQGHVEFLEYAISSGCPLDNQACGHRAARSGKVECLKLMVQNGHDMNVMTCKHAASNLSDECLVYAHENGCPWDARTCASAAEKGSLECLRYAHENGCPWDAMTCASDAEGGSLECLRYAHENGCPWDAMTCANAASTVSLECLRYAHENNCPWNSQVFTILKQRKLGASPYYPYFQQIMACIEYATMYGCPQIDV